MRLSLRTLLAFEDRLFDQEQHQQLERLIPKHDAASTMLNRIRSTVRNPRLGVPGLVDQREELDPNLVAEYLDHQMPEEIQERFETYCLSSDKYLAEITSIHHVLSNVLGEPARTSCECRQRCYDLYRSPIIEHVPTEKREKEKKEADLPFGSRQLLFEDYLPPTTQHSGNVGTTGLKEFQVNHTPPTSKSNSSERPELIIFPKQNETGNQLPSFNSTQPSTLPPSLFSSQTNNPAFSQINTPTTKIDNNIAAPIVPMEQKKVQPLPLTTLFWNWLTTGRTENNITEYKTENSTIKSETKTRKIISLWTLFMIFLLGTTGWLGWNKVQEKWNHSQQKKETAFRNIQQSDVTGLTSGVSESSNVPENTTAETLPFPVAEMKEKPAVSTALQKPPKKPIKIVPSDTPASPPQQLNEKTSQSLLPNNNNATASTLKTLPPVPSTETVNTAAVHEINAPTETQTQTATPIKTEFQEQISDSVTSVPSTESTAVMLKSTETPLSEKPTEKSIEKPMSFAPNPMRHSQIVSVPTTDNSEKQSSPISPTTDSAITVPVITELAAKPAKRNEKPEIRNSNTVARVTPTNFETPIQSKPLLVAMPEREPEQFDDQSLIAFQPISAPPKRKDVPQISPEFVEPKHQESAAFNPNNPKNSNAWRTSVVNQIPTEHTIERPLERQMEQRMEQSENAYSDRLTKNRLNELEELRSSQKPLSSFGNVVGNTTIPMESALPAQRQHVIPVGELRERSEIPQPRVLGRILAVKEPCIVFSASTASDQWEMKRLPLALHADQYLLTTAPFRAVVELESGFQVEMVGDSKFCLLEPDENGISGIFIDYGRLVIRPTVAENKAITPSLRLQTEKVHGTVHLTDSKSLVFVDTFAEILDNNSNESVPNRPVLPQTRPILGLIPDVNGKISWQVDRVSLVANKQAGVLLVAEKPELGNIQGLPNWLNPLPLPPESEHLATVCHRIFDKTEGNCEAALNLLIREPSIMVRSFGYRLWGDLGRFDIPLTFLSEAKPEDETIRQVLVPYFREVMKRDEETVQRLADAIETVRH
ncbi:MAG: hypothetical protein LBF88_13400 [Planctomycetaceae bacterium]|jgi:hypothetical protein|nr:hypothetical protein [Planctomycetaceae bacterium]